MTLSHQAKQTCDLWWFKSNYQTYKTVQKKRNQAQVQENHMLWVSEPNLLPDIRLSVVDVHSLEKLEKFHAVEVTDEDGCSCVSLCWQYERVGCRCWWSVHTNRRSGFITGCKMMLRHWNVQVLWNNTIQYRKTWTWMLIWSNTASVFTADMLKHSACCHHLFSTTLWIWFVSCLSVSGTEYLYCHTL